MGLEALLLGGHAEGVRNILAVTGDPPEVGDYPGSKGIYEVDAIGLTQLIAHLNAGHNYNGKLIDSATSFFIGVAVNPTADDLELEADRFRRKVEAGAQFAMTQILFDLRYLDEFRERIGGTWPIPVIVGLFPLSTYRLALRLHNEVPGIVVPDALQEAMRDAGPGSGRDRHGPRAGARPRAAREGRRHLHRDAVPASAGGARCPPRQLNGSRLTRGGAKCESPAFLGRAAVVRGGVSGVRVRTRRACFRPAVRRSAAAAGGARRRHRQVADAV